MEKENRQANADCTGVCEKIYNAVAFRAIHRKSSRSLPSPMAVITDPNQPGAQRTDDNAAKTNALEKPVAQHDGEVHNPIEFGPTAVQEERKKPKARAAAGDQEGRQPEHSRTASNLFSDYITRAKNKMRTPSNVSEETVNTSPFTRLATRRDSFNDKVVNYINRARKGIRTTSNVGK